MEDFYAIVPGSAGNPGCKIVILDFKPELGSEQRPEDEEEAGEATMKANADWHQKETGHTLLFPQMQDLVDRRQLEKCDEG